jgi:DNA-binding XRE family transcriptional regulator
LREYRIRAGLNQSGLGAKAGVTFQPDSEIRERRREAVPQLSTFATKLAVAVDELSKDVPIESPCFMECPYDHRMGHAELTREPST